MPELVNPEHEGLIRKLFMGLVLRWLIFIGSCLVTDATRGQKWGKLKNETSRVLSLIDPRGRDTREDDSAD